MTGTAHDLTALHHSGQALGNLTAKPQQYKGELNDSRVPSDAWGLLGQVYFHGKYEELLGHLSTHIDNMGKGLDSAAGKVKDTAQSYTDNEKAAADAFGKIQNQLSSATKAPRVGASSNSGGDAAKSIPMAGNAFKGVGDTGQFLKDINGDATGADITNDVTNVVSDGVGMASDVVGFASDPIGWIINKGVSFIIDIIKPLKDALEMVTGNGAAVTKAAGNFNNLGKDIEDLSTQFEQVLNTGFASSRGAATDAAREQLSNFRDGIAGTAGRSGDIAQLLQLSGMIMQAAEDFIKGIITDVIEFILLSQVGGAILSFFTFGAAEVAATAADAAKVAEEAVKAEKKVQEVSSLLQKITKVWNKIGEKFLNGAAGKTFEKMLVKPELKKAGEHGVQEAVSLSFSKGLKTTLKESARKQGFQSVLGGDVPKKGDPGNEFLNSSDSPEPGLKTASRELGYAKQFGKLTTAGEYGETGNSASDERIDQDFEG